MSTPHSQRQGLRAGARWAQAACAGSLGTALALLTACSSSDRGAVSLPVGDSGSDAHAPSGELVSDADSGRSEDASEDDAHRESSGAVFPQSTRDLPSESVDSAKNGARAAFWLQFRGSGNCAAASHDVYLPKGPTGGPAASVSQVEQVIADKKGATVQCRIAPTAHGFSVVGTVLAAPISLTVSADEVTMGASSPGSVGMSDALTGLPYVTPLAQSCTLQVGPREDQGLTVSAGKIWATVVCPRVTLEAKTEVEGCAIAGGVFYFDGCAEQ